MIGYIIGGVMILVGACVVGAAIGFWQCNYLAAKVRDGEE